MKPINNRHLSGRINRLKQVVQKIGQAIDIKDDEEETTDEIESLKEEADQAIQRMEELIEEDPAFKGCVPIRALPDTYRGSLRTAANAQSGRIADEVAHSLQMDEELFAVDVKDVAEYSSAMKQRIEDGGR